MSTGEWNFGTATLFVMYSMFILSVKERTGADSRRYQQAGNSMTVAVVEMIFNQINKAISGKKPKDSLF